MDISWALARGSDVAVASHGTRSKWRVMSHSSCHVKGNCNPLQSQGQWSISFCTTRPMGTELHVLIINVTLSADSWDSCTYGTDNPRRF